VQFKTLANEIVEFSGPIVFVLSDITFKYVIGLNRLL